ncbi:MAG: extracellular solute-binding protein [Anaerolineae bacterium]|nr:extracellular solute-binding protein [Anaerolineae bacterium]
MKFRVQRISRRLTACILPCLGALLVACSVGTVSPAADTTAESIRTDTPAPIALQPTALPTATFEPTPLPPTTLVIWWPEPLAPLNNSSAAELLSEQISAFKAAQGNVEVQLRRKLQSGVGGIMSTLRAASPVAPGALPDLTLMRREDVLTAAQAGLIYPMEGHVTSAVLGDLYRAALGLGRYDGALFGLPYMIDVQHMAYSSPADTQRPTRFEDFLAQQISFALPVAQSSVINDVLLTQYLDAGGTLPENGIQDINVEALLSVLNFDEQAVQDGLIDRGVLNYTSPADYQNSLVAGTLDAAVVNSSLYLSLLEAGDTLDFGPVPTESGSLAGEVDSWMWVITTSSADRQALAARFLNWMLDATRQGDYSRSIHMIPSQRTALQTWEDTPYITFVRQLLNNALLPLTNVESGTVARAMQNALVAVISGEATAETAVQDLLNRLAG